MPSRSLNLALLTLALCSAQPTWAAPTPARLAQIDLEEAPPPREPPYPSDEPLRAEISREIQPADEPPQSIERPYKVDEEDTYYYDTKSPPPAPKGHSEVVQPKSTESDGSFVYDKTVTPSPFSNTPGIEAPEQTLSSGEFRYKIPPNKSKHAASFRFSVLTPPQLQNKYNRLKYSDIYGGNLLPALVVDYEWKRLVTSVGRISIKLNSGIAVASGPGHFKDPNRANEVPDERYTFMLFPNSVTAHFRFQFWEKQIFVPFVEGGGGYYTVMEIRDDGARPRVGGGLVALGGGGVYILLDWADPQAVRELSNEYGINHVWLALVGRGAVNLGSDLDFTSFEGGAGFMMEF